MVGYYVSDIKCFYSLRHFSICLTCCWLSFFPEVTLRSFIFSTAFIIWWSVLIDSAADKVPIIMNSEFSFKDWCEKSQQKREIDFSKKSWQSVIFRGRYKQLHRQRIGLNCSGRNLVIIYI